MRPFEPIKINSCSAKPTAPNSSIIKGTWFLVLSLFLRILVAYNQGKEDATPHFWLLIQYSHGEGVIFSRV